MSEIIFTPLKKFSDSRGEVRRVMRHSDPGFQGFEEVYVSVIKKNVIKGWKRHNKMTLNFVPLFGSISVAVINSDEINKGSKFKIFNLSLENYGRLTIPPGFWVAFKAINCESGMLNFADLIHDPNEVDIQDHHELPLNINWTGL